jgi:hypothetical protein
LHRVAPPRSIEWQGQASPRRDRRASIAIKTSDAPHPGHRTRERRDAPRKMPPPRRTLARVLCSCAIVQSAVHARCLSEGTGDAQYSHTRPRNGATSEGHLSPGVASPATVKIWDYSLPRSLEPSSALPSPGPPFPAHHRRTAHWHRRPPRLAPEPLRRFLYAPPPSKKNNQPHSTRLQVRLGASVMTTQCALHPPGRASDLAAWS